MRTTARINAMIDAENVTGDKMSLHTAFSSTGANEVTGGTYARQTITYAAAAGRSKAAIGTISFTGLPSTTVAWLGLWDSTSTIFKGMVANGGAERSFQVDLTNNRFYCEGHGMVDGDRMVVTGATLPTGITEGEPLYVIGTTAGDPDYLQASLTAGGAPIDITTNQPSADARLSKIVLEVYNAAGSQHGIASFTTGM